MFKTWKTKTSSSSSLDDLDIGQDGEEVSPGGRDRDAGVEDEPAGLRHHEGVLHPAPRGPRAGPQTVVEDEAITASHDDLAVLEGFAGEDWSVEDGEVAPVGGEPVPFQQG